MSISLAAQPVRFCLRTVLITVTAYPLFLLVAQIARLLPLHPVDQALTAGMLGVSVAMSMTCWLLGAFRALLFSACVMMTATALTMALLMVGH